jgi:serine/threonine-protein kinase RsbW
MTDRKNDMPKSPCSESCMDMDPENLETMLELEIPGDVEAVAPTVNQIMEQVREVGCVEGHEFEVEVALLEAIANAVEHGCRGDADKRVSVRVVCHCDHGLLIIVRDPGEGFEPGQIPSPVEGDNLFRTHGRGVWLINSLMDHVTFERGGTELRMHKKKTKPKDE